MAYDHPEPSPLCTAMLGFHERRGLTLSVPLQGQGSSGKVQVHSAKALALTCTEAPVKSPTPHPPFGPKANKRRLGLIRM